MYFPRSGQANRLPDGLVELAMTQQNTVDCILIKHMLRCYLSGCFNNAYFTNLQLQLNTHVQCITIFP